MRSVCQWRLHCCEDLISQVLRKFCKSCSAHSLPIITSTQAVSLGISQLQSFQSRGVRGVSVDKTAIGFSFLHPPQLNYRQVALITFKTIYVFCLPICFSPVHFHSHSWPKVTQDFHRDDQLTLRVVSMPPFVPQDFAFTCFLKFHILTLSHCIMYSLPDAIID